MTKKNDLLISSFTLDAIVYILKWKSVRVFCEGMCKMKYYVQNMQKKKMCRIIAPLDKQRRTRRYIYIYI